MRAEAHGDELVVTIEAGEMPVRGYADGGADGRVIAAMMPR